MDGSGLTLYIRNTQDPGNVFDGKKFQKKFKKGEIIQKNMFRVKKTTRGKTALGLSASVYIIDTTTHTRKLKYTHGSECKRS